MIEPYYDKNGITIYHGDCAEVLPTLGRFDLLLTDPPYGIGRVMKGGKNTGHWGKLSSGNTWDMETPDLKLALSKAERQIVWGGNYFPLPPTRGVVAWRKLNAVPTQSDFELAWTSLDQPAKMFAYKSGGALKTNGHPTQKPLALMQWCLGFVKDAESVVDPFMGSGTTLVAAKLAGMTATGIEREERYCEIAAKRLAQGVFAFDEVSA